MREEPLFPRLAATLLMGVLLTVLSTTLFSWWAIGPLKLRPVEVVIVSAGFRLPLLWGGALVFILGYMTDLISGGVIGLHVVAYMVVLAACSMAQRKLQISSWPFQMVAVAVMTTVSQLLVEAGLMLVRREHLAPVNLHWLMAAQSALTALTAPLFFSALETLVRIFNRLRPGGRGARS